MRPGITGWAQINGGNQLSIEDKAALDAWYIANASLMLDLRILFRTLAVAIRGEERDPIAIKMARMLYHRRQRRRLDQLDHRKKASKQHRKIRDTQIGSANLSPVDIPNNEAAHSV